MSTALNLLAVQNADVLRALEYRPIDGWGLTEIANRVGRDKSNLSKTLKKLEDDGLAAFNPLTHGLTEVGQQQLAMIEKAESNGTGDEPGSSTGGIVWLRHAEIAPDPDNARRDWDSDDARDDLDALRSDIIRNDLLQNMVVRAPETEGLPHILVGGERRWRAIGIAISDGDIEAATPYACRLLETDELGVRLAALAENLQRRNLNPIEKARAFEGLAEAGLSNKEIADRVSSTPEHIQQHRRFLQLDETDQQRMTLAKDDPSHLSVREARQKLARKGEEETAAAEEAERKAKITPEVRLAMAEFIHRVRNEATYTYADIPVAHDARSTPLAAQIDELGWLHFSQSHQPFGLLAGQYTARLAYNCEALGFFEWHASSDAAERDAGLAQVYAELAYPQIAPETGYLTPWLAPSPALTAEGELTANAAQVSRDAANNERNERNRIEKAQKAACLAARTRHLELLNNKTASIETITTETATAIERSLPWIMDGTSILDANGQQVRRYASYCGETSDFDIALAQITVSAVNATGGFSEAPLMLPPEPEETEEDAA